MSRCVTLAALAAVVVSVSRVPAPSAGHEKKDMTSLYRPNDLKWQDGPPSLPPGAKIAVLEGDPTKPGPFVFRVKVPDGYKIPPHTHPKPERVTVISGTFNLGTGDTFDASKTEALPAGTYGTWPTGMKHFVWVKGETVVQFHGDGPWAIEYLNPTDDPRAKKKER
jgi:quercetin dioxygenase-like cupin family protein